MDVGPIWSPPIAKENQVYLLGTQSLLQDFATNCVHNFHEFGLNS